VVRVQSAGTKGTAESLVPVASTLCRTCLNGSYFRHQLQQKPRPWSGLFVFSVSTSRDYVGNRLFQLRKVAFDLSKMLRSLQSQ